AAYSGSIGKATALNPADVRRIHTLARVRVTIPRSAAQRSGRRRQHRATVERCVWIADVGTIVVETVVVAIEAVSVLNSVGSPGLKRRDARNGPSPKDAPREAV